MSLQRPRGAAATGLGGGWNGLGPAMRRRGAGEGPGLRAVGGADGCQGLRRYQVGLGGGWQGLRERFILQSGVAMG